ncbi:MAG TPA: UPF0158 family protein [Anaerolineales bacterium]|nr:UPF0158 family protein [Anaerolineales bacterium]
MVKFSDVQDAFFFVSSAGYGLHSAVLRRDTGQIYCRSEEGDLDEIANQDLDRGRCIDIPHKNDLGLGHQLVSEFVENQLPDEYQHVQQIFQMRGAYGRFKDLLEANGLLQSWYDFEDRREEQALRQWCDENEVELSG